MFLELVAYCIAKGLAYCSTTIVIQKPKESSNLYETYSGCNYFLREICPCHCMAVIELESNPRPLPSMRHQCHLHISAI